MNLNSQTFDPAVQQYIDDFKRSAPDMPGIDASVGCPDPTRSPTGAWTLPGNLQTRASELQAANPSLTLAQCFEFLGAKWSEHWNSGPGPNDPPMVFFFTDPVKTVFTRVSDGVEQRGGWAMSQPQKAEADGLKAANPGWEWSKCCEEVGGRWSPYYFYLVMDNVGGEASDTAGPA